MAFEAIKKVLANVIQNFTEAEKQTARNNIGAAASSEVIHDVVRYGVTQTLTETEKAMARMNIGANQEQSDWLQSNPLAVDFIRNKPTIPAPQVNSDWNANSGVAEILNKPTLATVATSGSYNDLSNKPSIPAAQVNSDWNASSGVAQILNKPSLATVATSGSYNDLSDKPSIPAAQVQSDWNQSDNTKVDFIKNKPTIPAAQVNSDWNASSGVAQILNKPSLATVATSGSYTDLSNTPSIPAAQVNSDWNASSGVAQILNKPESKYFLWDTTSANGFDIWANIYDANDHYTAWLPICLLEDDPDTSSSNSAILHTNFSSAQQSGITVYSEAMTTSYLTRATSSHIALSKGLWYYEFAIELVPTQIVSGIADMKINVYSQVYDSPTSIPSYYMIKNIEAPTNCNVQSTYTRMISGVIYSIRDFTFDSQGLLSSGQTLGIMLDINSSTVPSGAAFKFRQTGLHLVKLGI